MGSERESSYLMENRGSRFFYGYIVVFIAFCIMLVADGTFYSFGVFFEPVLTAFGWTRAATSGAYSLLMIITGLLSIVAGRLNDRFGPRILLTGCGFFIGLGYLLMSQIGAIWQLYVFFGIIVAIGMSAFLVPLLSTVARWFVKRRGLMCGIAIAGVGVGTTFIPPIASRLISIYGWRTSYLIVGTMALVLIITLAQFLKRDPGKVGQLLDGGGETEENKIDLQTSGLSLREAIHTRQLWLLCGLSFAYYLATAVIFVHVVIHATGLGIPPVSAANILAIIGVASIVGRVVMGTVADRIGNRLALMVCFAIMAIALIWLMVIAEVWMFYLFAAIFGLGYGGGAALKSPVTAELFGLSSHGVLLGMTFFSDCMGGVVGPVLAGGIFDITGSYQWAFVACIVSSVAALVLASLLRPTQGKDSIQDV